MSANDLPIQPVAGPGQSGTPQTGAAQSGSPHAATSQGGMSEQAPTVATFYDEVGGHPTFVRIVGRFYELVSGDPILQPLYPEQDLGPAEVRMRMFLEQYWGGPRTYSQLRGHPRLRMRHAPFVIGIAERDAWLAAMRQAIDEAQLTPDQDSRLWGYLVMAADSMVNSLQ